MPIEIPRAAARSINVHGRVVVPWLGVSGNDDGRHRPAPASQTVAAGSPASVAGLQAGDIIISMDGQPIDSMAVLALSLRDYDAGAMVDLALHPRMVSAHACGRARRTALVDVALAASARAATVRPATLTDWRARRTSRRDQAARGPRRARPTPTPAPASASSCLRFGLSIVHHRASVPATYACSLV